MRDCRKYTQDETINTKPDMFCLKTVYLPLTMLHARRIFASAGSCNRYIIEGGLQFKATMCSRGIFFFHFPLPLVFLRINRSVQQKTRKQNMKQNSKINQITCCLPLFFASSPSSSSFPPSLPLSSRRVERVRLNRLEQDFYTKEKKRKTKKTKKDITPSTKNALRYEWNTVIFPSEALQRCSKKRFQKVI